ncbi:zinc ribbon domain-containing protein [bacterium]|nr:zinc ribbon domain-containing protein [bacterium]MBU1634527.1 zinc ribbon domain-containing protein [bacterium]MBU1872870.1 zinc ribbon domain-containing protein [bacterium]
MMKCNSCQAPLSNSRYKFCPYCGVKLIEKGVCPFCEHKNSINAKFCSECGKWIDVDHEVTKQFNTSSTNDDRDVTHTIVPPIPSDGITLEFGQSTSANYENAVLIAKTLSPIIFKYGKKKSIRVNIEKSDILKIIDLAQIVCGWNYSKLYLDGQQVTYDSIFGFRWCHKKKLCSYKPDLYCYGYDKSNFNIWGCTALNLPFSPYSEFWKWGKFINADKDWAIDKDRIKFEIEKKIYNYRFCPAVKLEYIYNVISALPDIVNPDKNNNWKFITSGVYDQDSELLSGLICTEKNQWGDVYKVRYYGVAPRKKDVLIEILKKIKHRIPTPNFDFQE